MTNNNESETKRLLAENWASVQSDVADASTKAGRSPNSVKIIGVAKYVDAMTTHALYEVGCHHLGESRPQLLWKKGEAFDEYQVDSTELHCHMIWHLQLNKVRRTIKLDATIHSVDSRRLLAAIAEEATAQAKVVDVLLEANISGEEAKTGMNRDALCELLDTPPPTGVRIQGLMAMAGWGTDADAARKQFAAARALRDDLQTRSGLVLEELSMGMSGDFAAAIAEGATMVRIGTRLFNGILPEK